MAKVEAKLERWDGWTNLITGMGTSRDKTSYGYHAPNCILDEWQLTSMYNNDDLSAKIVNIYPEECLRRGFKWRFDGAYDEDKTRYLEKFQLPSLARMNWIWARLYGNSALWPIVDDGTFIPEQPLGKVRNVRAVRIVDRRFLSPLRWYESGPKIGQVELYNLNAVAGYAATVGVIHESRLVMFPGAMTDAQSKRDNQGWDLSVLQRPYEAVRSAGTVWKGIETLVSDANQGVFKIKDLFKMVAAKKSEALLERLKIMDLARSVMRAIALDADTEDFQRQATTFTGLSDLDARGLLRVAMAGEYPVAILTGQSFTGLNATGSADLQWFGSRADGKRKNEIEPPLIQLARILLQPLGVTEDTPITIDWPDIWEPSGKEKAEQYKIQAEGDQIYMVNEVVLPEEVALSRFGEDSAPLQLELELREKILQEEKARIQSGEGGRIGPGAPQQGATGPKGDNTTGPTGPSEPPDAEDPTGPTGEG